MLKKVRVKAPSSTSNLGPGFDVFGLALDVFYDEVEIIISDEKGIRIEIEGQGSEFIPKKLEENTAGRTALEFSRLYSLPDIKIKLVKGIPPGRGLASSGVSAAATAVALNLFLDLHLSQRKLVEIAMIGEQVASGTLHADDIAPSIYGGFTIIQSYSPLTIISVPPPRKILFALAVPQVLTKSTKDLRDSLPTKVAMSNAISNIGSASALVAGIFSSNPKIIGQAMMGDKIVEHYRISRFPVLKKVQEAALKSGACGATISGAGPTMIAVVDPIQADPNIIAAAMSGEFENAGVICKCYVAKATGPARMI